MASSVKKKDLKALREARYLAKEIAHRLPAKGKIVPTPEPHERLVFYYGLDFHDLAPNFILNISAFIVVCEAFFCIQPHFGLWLKIFSVKPKVVQGRQAECGGAMVVKIANVT